MSRTKKPSAAGGKRGGLGGARDVAVRVKTARGRKLSSTKWLERQLNDPYVAAAKRDGWRSRAAYKLIDLDDRFGLIGRGCRAVDLGAAPGGWTQVLVQRAGAEKGRGKVVALDMLAMEPVPGATVLELDFLADDAPARLTAALGGPADLVVSDMAAPTTGNKDTDYIRTMGLCEAALDYATAVLAPGGAFVCKVFQGGADKALLDAMKRSFKTVKHAKPPSSRKQSREAYVVCQGFKGRAADPSAADPDAADGGWQPV